MSAALAGLLTCFSLIVAIGAQNAYLLRLGLSRHHVGIAATICAASDVALILLGIAGIGTIIRSAPGTLQVVRWFGVAFLIAFSLLSFWRARRPQVLLPANTERPTLRTVALTTLAFTFLNPHVYLDTVLLLGSVGNQYGHHRWWFAAGASTCSIIWFYGLGYGARAVSRFMSRPATWRVLDVLIGIVMLLVATSIATTPLPT